MQDCSWNQNEFHNGQVKGVNQESVVKYNQTWSAGVAAGRTQGGGDVALELCV